MSITATTAAEWNTSVADHVAPLTASGWLRFSTVSRMLPSGVDDVLEVGCGEGAFGARIAHRYNYVGVEPDPASWAVARDRVAAVGRGRVLNGDSRSLAAGERYDLVCAFEVLEHIKDDAAALRQWRELIRPGGWLLLSVPAYERRYSITDRLVGHYRRYDPPAVAELLTACGFEDVETRLYGFPVGYALEFLRNLIAWQRMGRPRGALVSRRFDDENDEVMAERSGGSGRWHQPKRTWQAVALRWGTGPFRVVQRGFPRAGVGLVVRARVQQ